MKTRRHFIAAFLGFAISAAALCTPALAADFEQRAHDFIAALAERAVASLTVADTPHEERINRFRELFNEHFAVRGIGKWILGRHWKKASEEQQNEYLVLFEDLMVVSYVDRFARYTGETLEITKTLAKEKKSVIVYSKIIMPKTNSQVRVDWRVAPKDDTFKIVDVFVEGMSMSATLKSEFGSIIRQKGGSIDGLLEALRKKTQDLKERPAK